MDKKSKLTIEARRNNCIFGSNCFFCGGHYMMDVVTADLRIGESELKANICPECLREGPENLAQRVRDHANWLIERVKTLLDVVVKINEAEVESWLTDHKLDALCEEESQRIFSEEDGLPPYIVSPSREEIGAVESEVKIPSFEMLKEAANTINQYLDYIENDRIEF